MRQFSRLTYTVLPGDTLFTIARKFGTTAEAIKQANNLTSNVIYIGQQLSIPGESDRERIYVVQPGDTLYKIAQRFNTTVESIIALNNLTSQALTVGQRLQIPLYTEVTVTVDSANVRTAPTTASTILARMVRGAKLPVTGFRNGWYKVRLYNRREGWILGTLVRRNVYGAEKPISGILGFYTTEEGPGLPSSFTSFANNTGEISELGLFMWRIDAENPTQIEKFGEFSDQDVRTLVAIAHRNNIRILPVVHNLLYRPGGTATSKNTVKTLVSTPQNRRAFIQNLIELIEKFNFDGVNIDIEDVYIEDKSRLSALYTEMGAALHARGYYLSGSIPSRISDEPFNPFSDPFDYAAIGKAVDEFVVMLYNEHGWPGSGPGPVVSIGWMRRVLNYTITRVPKEKVVAAVSVFGFDFNLTTERNRLVTHAQAIALANRYNAQIRFDAATQTPMFPYTDAQGNKHEVWFENSASIKSKINLAVELGIAGIALWRLGLEDPAIWTMLERDVVVKRY